MLLVASVSDFRYKFSLVSLRNIEIVSALVFRINSHHFPPESSLTNNLFPKMGGRRGKEPDIAM